MTQPQLQQADLSIVFEQDAKELQGIIFNDKESIIRNSERLIEVAKLAQKKIQNRKEINSERLYEPVKY